MLAALSSRKVSNETLFWWINVLQAENSVDKDFFKLLNNANIGYDCRNNSDNCIFEPICDETVDISYIKKYNNIFHKSVSSFLNSKIVEEEINNEFSGKLLKISDNDRLRDEKINSLQVKRNEELEVVGRIREQERNYTGRKR